MSENGDLPIAIGFPVQKFPLFSIACTPPSIPAKRAVMPALMPAAFKLGLKVPFVPKEVPPVVINRRDKHSDACIPIHCFTGQANGLTNDD